MVTWTFWRPVPPPAPSSAAARPPGVRGPRTRGDLRGGKAPPSSPFGTSEAAPHRAEGQSKDRTERRKDRPPPQGGKDSREAAQGGQGHGRACPERTARQLCCLLK